MSKMNIGAPIHFRKEFLDHIDEWFTDERVKSILFLSPEEEKELAEKRKRDAKVMKKEFLDDWDY